MSNIAPRFIQTNPYPALSRQLSDWWRDDIAAVARRQSGWCAEFRDWFILECPHYRQCARNDWIVLFGDPALLVCCNDGRRQSWRVRNYERGALHRLAHSACFDQRAHLRDELNVCSLL